MFLDLAPPPQPDLDAYDAARVVIIILGLAAIVLMTINNWDNVRFSRFSIGDALVRLGVVGVLFAVTFSTVEVLLDWHTQIRIYVLTASLVWMVVGLSWLLKDKRKKKVN